MHWSTEQHCLRLDNVLSCISVTVQRQEEVYTYSNLFDRENIEMKEVIVWEKENSLNVSRSLKFGGILVMFDPVFLPNATL